MAPLDSQTFSSRMKWLAYTEKPQRKRPAKCWPFLFWSFDLRPLENDRSTVRKLCKPDLLVVLSKFQPRNNTY